MILKIKAFPKSKHEKIERRKSRLHVYIKEPAENNRANDAIVDFLRKEFPKATSIRIISGHMKPTKTIEILGVDEALF